MRNQILQQVKKISRNTKRFMALGLAAIVTVMSVNPMQVVAAAQSTTPTYDSATGKYNFYSGDIFGAATHVHLFGREVSTTGVHTHGNIMAEIATIGEIGMRDGKVSYPTSYTEYSYVGTTINEVASDIHSDLILGTVASGHVTGSGTGSLTYADGTHSVPLTNYISEADVHMSSTVNAVDIVGTLNSLADLSSYWAAQSTSSYVDISLDANTHNATVDTGSYDMNRRYIYTNQAANGTSSYTFINIPYSVFNGNEITMTGIDANANHSGIVVINIDMAGTQNATVNVSGGGIKVQGVDSNGTTFSYNNEEHTSAAFGTCRIVYNIIDSDKPDNVYTGNLTWTGVVFGSILAPKASVTVGAVNGTVMADRIVHTDGESHRMDIYPLFNSVAEDGTVTTKTEYNEIRLLLEVMDENGNEVKEAAGLGTSYAIYSDSSCSSNRVVEPVSVVWNAGLDKYEMVINSEQVTALVDNHTLTPGTTYYIGKSEITSGYSTGYEDAAGHRNDNVYSVKLNTNGTVSYQLVNNGSTETPSHSVRTDVIRIGATSGGGATPTYKPVEEIVLELVLKDSEDHVVTEGTDYAGITYDVVDSNGNIVISNQSATNGGSGSYILRIEGKTTQQLPAGEYTFQRDPNSNYVGVNDTYKFKVDSNGNVTYMQPNGTYSAASPVDVLKKPASTQTTLVGEVKLIVTLVNSTPPTNYGTSSGAIYNVVPEGDTTSVLSGIPAIWNGSEYVVVIPQGSSALELGKNYYFDRVDEPDNWENDTGFGKQYAFNVAQNGTVNYPNGNRDQLVTTPQSSNTSNVQEVKLTVTLEGSNNVADYNEVVYDVVDTSTNPQSSVLTSLPVTSSGSTYQVTIPAGSPALTPGHSYTFVRGDEPDNWENADGYGRIYNFTVESDGTITYKDSNGNTIASLEDKLVTQSSSGSTGGNNGGNNNNNSTGSTDNNTSGGTTNTTNNTTTDTTNTTTTPSENGVPVTTDGSAAGGSGSVATGGDASATGGDASATGGSDLTATGGDTDMLTSANTGEFNAGGVFAGYVAVLAIAAVAYVLTKKKRA